MIQVLSRCFAVLELLGEGEYTLSELATKMELRRTTLRNILRTLETLNIVGRNGVKYRLGSRLMELGDAARAQQREAPAPKAKIAPARKNVPQGTPPKPKPASAPAQIESEKPSRRWAGFRS